MFEKIPFIGRLFGKKDIAISSGTKVNVSDALVISDKLQKKILEHLHSLDGLLEKRKDLFESNFFTSSDLNVYDRNLLAGYLFDIREFKKNTDLLLKFIPQIDKEIFRSEDIHIIEREFNSLEINSSVRQKLESQMTKLRQIYSLWEPDMKLILSNLRLQDDVICKILIIFENRSPFNKEDFNSKLSNLKDLQVQLNKIIDNLLSKYLNLIFNKSDELNSLKKNGKFVTKMAFVFFLFLTSFQVAGPFSQSGHFKSTNEITYTEEQRLKIQRQLEMKKNPVRAVTYYADFFEDRHTKLGPKFSHKKLMCAVPIGSPLLGKKLELYNPHTRKSIVVKAVDVGNFGYNSHEMRYNKYPTISVENSSEKINVQRGFDLSLAAFHGLGFDKSHGAGVVQWRVINDKHDKNA